MSGSDDDLAEEFSAEDASPGKSSVAAATGEVFDDTPEDFAGAAQGDDDPIMMILELLERLSARVDAIDDMLTSIPDGPWAWASLDPTQQKRLWRRLYDWVAWLEDRYLRNLSASRIGVFSADWYRHPVAVELLTALMVSHISAYRRKESVPSFTLVEWHERCLWPTLARFQMLGLFTADTGNSDWPGPTPWASRRNDQRFEEFLRL